MTLTIFPENPRKYFSRFGRKWVNDDDYNDNETNICNRTSFVLSSGWKLTINQIEDYYTRNGLQFKIAIENWIGRQRACKPRISSNKTIKIQTIFAF